MAPNPVRTPLIVPVVFFLVCAALPLTALFGTPDVALVNLALLFGSLLFYVLFVEASGCRRFEWVQKSADKLNGRLFFDDLVWCFCDFRRSETVPSTSK